MTTPTKPSRSRLPFVIREIRDGDLTFIVENIRSADAQELEAAYGHQDFLPGLEASVAASDEARICELDGDPVAVFGIRRFVTSTAAIFCVATGRVAETDRHLVRQSRRVIGQWFKGRRRLRTMLNYVSAKGIAHQHWLATLGAEFSPAVPMGATGALFHPFAIRRRSK